MFRKEKGGGYNLCEAHSGPFRQIGPVPFFLHDFGKETLVCYEERAERDMESPMDVVWPFRSRSARETYLGCELARNAERRFTRSTSVWTCSF
jgi:hypothetical protein